jgi:glycogen debranching enzyme
MGCEMKQHNHSLRAIFTWLMVWVLVSSGLVACQEQGPLADPVLYSAESIQPVLQNLVLPGLIADGKPVQSRNSSPDTLFVATGRKLYVLGDIDGGFRPRSNPYDLYDTGKPSPTDPLANKLQGVWAQPVKALNGYTFEIEKDSQVWTLYKAQRYTQSFVESRFEFQKDSLAATRTDFIPDDLPVLLTSITLDNQGALPVILEVRFKAYFDLEDAWFTSLAANRNQGESVSQEGERIIARAQTAPDAWAVAVGAGTGGARVSISLPPGQHPVGQYEYQVTLPAGGQQEWTFGVAVESQQGSMAALKALEDGLQQRTELREQKQALYANLMQDSPRLTTPDPGFDLAFSVAIANMQMMEADSPALGRYYFAGLQTFPFWFSGDTAYSAAGLAAAGLTDSLESALLVGTQINNDGRIPHQISPSGRIVGQGNAQETPQWVMAVWDAYRWTGDRGFLAKTYPTVLKGMFDYTLGKIDADGDNYPSGPGMVERNDMGAEKLDSAAYTWAALHSLENVAIVMGDAQSAAQARARINQIDASFDTTWWDETGGTYAMSLNEPNNARIPVPHWAVITPLEVGLATPSHAATTLKTIETSYLNQWGLKHTVGSDERVWVLGTAVLSRAAFRYNQPDLGLQMLQHIAQTMDYGSIGLFHELIPDGLCTVQLWSSATFVRSMVEDLLGIQVDAGQQAVTVAPQIPSSWSDVTLQNLSFGGHLLTVRASGGKIEIDHLSGPSCLKITLRLSSGAEKTIDLAPGEIASLVK